MHTEPLSASSSPGSPLAALLRSKWACLALLAGGLATLSSPSQADDFHTALGAGVGAAAGAAIGQSVGGRNGALVGAGAGGLVGASIAQGHYNAPRAMVMTPAVPVYRAYPSYQSRIYAPPPAVVWQPPPYRVQHWQPPRHHDHGHHYGGDQRRDYRGYAPAPRHELPFIDGRGDQERLRREHRDWRN